MALLHCEFYSKTLDLNTSMLVILPQPRRGHGASEPAGTAGPHPTLYLLHGLSDNHTTWLRRTGIERYVEPLGLAVVMPTTHRGFYTDTAAAGHRYFSFISDELPRIARSFFPLSDRREDNFVAGLSMGGYGSFKLALTFPKRFAAAAAMSGALDVANRAAEPATSPMSHREWESIFGDIDRIPGSGNDLFALAEHHATGTQPRPALFQCCGDDDPLIEDNRRFHEHLKSLGLPVDYREDRDRAHEWGYWDEAIQDVLAWLPLKQS